ncbi:SANTA domain-containing protein [Vairimorpha necatrix]|uniref:SANTA domain-containing protein n=1 Tax=Vairimorpha necatrix TaxID=6039 RepID=A0AAX4J8C5_9MICR
MNQKEDILRKEEFENLPDYTIFRRKTPQIKRFTRNNKKRLSKWHISFVKNNNPLIKYKYWISVNGYLDNNKLVQSSPILSIQAPFVVVTANTKYYLKESNEILKKPPHAKFDLDELAKFSKGFPNDWKKIVIKQLKEIYGAERLRLNVSDYERVLTPFDMLYNKIFNKQEEETESNDMINITRDEDKSNLELKSEAPRPTIKNKNLKRKIEEEDDLEIVPSSSHLDKLKDKKKKIEKTKKKHEEEKSSEAAKEDTKKIEKPHEKKKEKINEEDKSKKDIVNTKQIDESGDREIDIKYLQEISAKTGKSYQDVMDIISNKRKAKKEKTNNKNLRKNKEPPTDIKLEDIEEKDYIQDSKIIESLLSVENETDNAKKRKLKEETERKKKLKDTGNYENTGTSNKSLLEQIMNSRISRPYSYEELSNKEKKSIKQKKENSKSQKHNLKNKEELDRNRVNLERTKIKEETEKEKLKEKNDLIEKLKIENLKKLYKQNANIQKQKDIEDARENKSLFVDNKNMTSELESNATTNSLNVRKVKKRKSLCMPSKNKSKKK